MPNRVDEQRSEAQRAEAQRAEAQRAAKKQSEKGSEKKREMFEQLLKRGQTAGQERAQGNSRAQAQQATSKGRASDLLRARAGIEQAGREHNAFARTLAQAGEKHNAATSRASGERVRGLEGDRDSDTHHEEVQTDERTQKRVQERNDERLAPISRDDERGERGGDGGAGDGQAGDGRHDQSMGGQTPPFAIEGTQQSAPTQAAAAPNVPPERLRQLAEQMVQKVMTGVDTKGLGVAVLQLQDGVLGGAQLQIKADGKNLSIEVHTHDDQAGRVFSSGQTAHELADSLSQRDFSLVSLVVNDESVVRS